MYNMYVIQGLSGKITNYTDNEFLEEEPLSWKPADSVTRMAVLPPANSCT